MRGKVSVKHFDMGKTKTNNINNFIRYNIVKKASQYYSHVFVSPIENILLRYFKYFKD